MTDAYLGAKYVDGVDIEIALGESPPDPVYIPIDVTSQIWLGADVLLLSTLFPIRRLVATPIASKKASVQEHHQFLLRARKRGTHSHELQHPDS